MIFLWFFINIIKQTQWEIVAKPNIVEVPITKTFKKMDHLIIDLENLTVGLQVQEQFRKIRIDSMVMIIIEHRLGRLNINMILK
jgi:hypothetical protein